mmetsp:Transcript_42375/g.76929  ORF Transcript_42375/g.76929 Transcript_42375/m.76929 type:complete len:354 (+) Transcript_42375:40-1101(+)
MLRRAVCRLSAKSSEAAEPLVDLRVVREERINAARERIFGTRGTLPGDRFFKMPLQGNDFMTWYFPSKYQFPDFRVEEYFEMQAERLAPKEKHESMHDIGQVFQAAMDHKESLQRFFQNLSEEDFNNNPTLQDLYGIYRQVDAERGLSFAPHPSLFREHQPMFAVQPATEEGVESSQGDSQLDAATVIRMGVTQLYNMYCSILRSLKKTAKSNVAFHSEKFRLDARLIRKSSAKEVHSLLLSFAQEHGIAVPFDVTTLMPENGSLLPYSLPARPKEEADDLGGFAPYLKRRHRFVDPLFRRRRLKWLERLAANAHGEKTLKYHSSIYVLHPDELEEFPTNKGSVTVTWPSPYH